MQIFVFKILVTLSLIVFSLGISTMMLRKHSIWLIVGQIMALKGATFALFILASAYRSKMELLSLLLFTAVFFMVLFSLVGFGLTIRSRRFHSELGTK